MARCRRDVGEMKVVEKEPLFSGYVLLKGKIMAIALEKRFETLVSDVQAIQKELILPKMQHIKKTRRSQEVWKSLSQRVSATWDSVSAVDEISTLRDKQW